MEDGWGEIIDGLVGWLVLGEGGVFGLGKA